MAPSGSLSAHVNRARLEIRENDLLSQERASARHLMKLEQMGYSMGLVQQFHWVLLKTTGNTTGKIETVFTGGKLNPQTFTNSV